MHCEDCGTKLSSGRCPNCQEELLIFEDQIWADGMDMELSDDFVEKVEYQKEQVREFKETLKTK